MNRTMGFHDATGMQYRAGDAILRQDNGETAYRIAVTNSSDVPATQVWLEILCGTQDREALPSFWDDNALTLLPHEQRELTVRFRTASLGGAAPHVMVEGWNVVPRETDLRDGTAIALAMKMKRHAYSATPSEGTPPQSTQGHRRPRDPRRRETL